MALSWPRDDSYYHPHAGEHSTGSVGSFIELLKYMVRGGDKDLEKHFKATLKILLTYEKQNELI